MVQYNVRPGVHSLAVLFTKTMNLQQEIEVNLPDSDMSCLFLAATISKLPCLVTANVKILRIEERHKLAVKFRDKLDCVRVDGAKGCAPRKSAKPRLFA